MVVLQRDLHNRIIAACHALRLSLVRGDDAALKQPDKVSPPLANRQLDTSVIDREGVRGDLHREVQGWTGSQVLGLDDEIPF
jgi:hypothetical protein